MPYELGCGLIWLVQQSGCMGSVEKQKRLASAMHEPVKKWLRRYRHGALASDVKLPSGQFQQLRRGALLERVLDYYSEHEADQAQAEQIVSSRLKSLRGQIEKKVSENR